MRRAPRLVSVLGYLFLLPGTLHAQIEPSRIWITAGGEARLELRADYLPDFGLEVVDHGLVVREFVETHQRLDDDDRLQLTAPYGNFERFLSGGLTFDTGWLLRHRRREVRLDDLTWTPGIQTNGHPSLEARDKAGRHLLTLTHIHILADDERGLLTLHNADLVATAKLAELLELEVLGDRPIGMAWLDLNLRVPFGATTDGRPLGCEADRPYWPQGGHEADVILKRMSTVVYQGTDGDGRIKVAPSATLENVGAADIPWIPKFQSLGGGFEYPYDPADQHPFLVWNMYRISGGRIEQLSPSGAKHAFFSTNQNCTNCGSGNVLWLGCEDVYSSGNNNSSSALGPRDEIESGEGLFFSTCSFFDPGCTGMHTHDSEEFENRLMVDPTELETPDGEYFLDAWYLIQYDVDIWNSMGHRSLTPTPVDDGWDFEPLGPFTPGRVLDEWVDPAAPGPAADHAVVTIPSATPEEPYPDSMPQGHIVVAVRVTEPEDGRYRYGYAVQNFDFDRGVEAFRIPIPAGAEVFETYFGDIDDDAGNDWTISTDGDFVSFVAPADHPLPWFTLFNFEIEVDAPPADSQVTLALGGDAVAPRVDIATLAPATTGLPAPRFEPSGLAVGSAAGNGVLEPGERVEVLPSWRNDGAIAGSLTGIGKVFAGPSDATYTVVDANASYDTVDPLETASCEDGSDCYMLELGVPTVRPASHWDATFDEELDDADATEKTWTLHVGDSFVDVPRASPFYSAVEGLLHSGVTGGCTGNADGRDRARPLQGGAAYCPGDANTRAQMPVFMLRALEGVAYTPPACVDGGETFDDVPFGNAFCPWIEELADRGVVAGCGGGNYCPGAPVSRAQMAVFLLKTLEGDGYRPPECDGEFTDVTCPSLFADWIEDLAARGITGGCGTSEYCPADPVTRGQMAVFVIKTFGLELYGP